MAPLPAVGGRCRYEVCSGWHEERVGDRTVGPTGGGVGWAAGPVTCDEHDVIIRGDMTYRIRITDLMTRANELSVFEERVASLDDVRARCRSIREAAGEAIHVEAVPLRRVPVPRRRTTWAVA